MHHRGKAAAHSAVICQPGKVAEPDLLLEVDKISSVEVNLAFVGAIPEFLFWSLIFWFNVLVRLDLICFLFRQCTAQMFHDGFS